MRSIVSRRCVLPLVACVAIAVSTASAAADFSWTGRYEGITVCDSITEGVPSAFQIPFVIELVQTGDRVDMDTRSEGPIGGAPGTQRYRGSVRSSPDGEIVSGYVEACGGSFDYQELVRIFPAATSPDSFSFAADTVFVSTDVPGSEGDLVVQSCKWSMTRVSTEAPTIQRCE